MNEIIPFEKKEFGSLVTLPEKVKGWKVISDNIIVVADIFNKEVEKVDFNKLTDEQIQDYDSRLSAAINTIKSNFDNIETERKASTSIIDEIKAYAMLPEKSIADYPKIFKGYRDTIAREIGLRNKVAEEKRQNELEKKQEGLDVVGKLNAAFESIPAEPVISLASGTSVKKKYVINSHTDYTLVMTFWVGHNMHLLTPDELSKKLSFMVTAANKALNDGVIINGLSVEDDYSTRTNKKAV